MSACKPVIVLPYDEAWPKEFQKIRQPLEDALGDCVLAIEHVGSTSVEGLSAKPIIDIDVVIEDYNSLERVKARLARLGYVHEGDLGIKDRQAFKYAQLPHLMRHHLYVCPAYSDELKRHLAFRDHLRTSQADRDWYSEVKTLAAKHYPSDIDGYMKAKAPCVLEILSRCGVKNGGW